MAFHVIYFLEESGQELVHIVCLLFFLGPNVRQFVNLLPQYLHVVTMLVQQLLIFLDTLLVALDGPGDRWNMLLHERVRFVNLLQHCL